jgi:nicotinamide-nucleotide amidase
MSATRALAANALDACRDNSLMVATAESCTGGMVAAALTDIAGSSDVFERGFVTYSNEAKMELLGVEAATLEHHGAVSAETAIEMAEGALARSGADLAVSVTGIAGPGGGTQQKPVGLVWFAIARRGGKAYAREMRFGDTGRASIRADSTRVALELLAEAAAYAPRSNAEKTSE